MNISDLTYTVSMPFKRKGKGTLKETEFVLALSLDLKWFPPEQAKIILINAEKSGLLKREGEMVQPIFDIAGIEIPSGFKPGSPGIEEEALFDRIMDRIITDTGIEKRKVIAMINKKQEELAKQVAIEVSAIQVAVEMGIKMDDLIDEEFAALLT